MSSQTQIISLSYSKHGYDGELIMKQRRWQSEWRARQVDAERQNAATDGAKRATFHFISRDTYDVRREAPEGES